jgi:hypothetical protein
MASNEPAAECDHSDFVDICYWPSPVRLKSFAQENGRPADDCELPRLRDEVSYDGDGYEERRAIYTFAEGGFI